jgi:hypothetical protein
MVDLLDPTITPSYGSVDQETWDQLILSSATGIAQVRANRTTPRWVVKYLWNTVTGTNADTLLSFIRWAEGSFRTFNAYTVDPHRLWENAQIGWGTGSRTVFEVGGIQVEAGTETVKVDGTTQTVETDYTMSVESSGLKRSVVTFQSGHEPGDETQVYITYRGRRLLLGRFTSDPIVTVTGWRKVSITANFSGEEVSG